MIKKFNLYYDMDNTLALFSESRQHEKLVLEQMYEEGFFASLPPIDDCKSALKFINDAIGDSVEIFILSACIDSPFCKEEKRTWLDEHLPFIKKENIIFTKVGENKTDYIRTLPSESILVDDYHKNLVQWEEWGGIAIKKRSSQKEGYKYIVRNHWSILPILMGLFGE